MNRGLIIAPKARSLSASPRQLTRPVVRDEKRPPPDSEDAMQVRQRIMKVARRLGTGVRCAFAVDGRGVAGDEVVAEEIAVRDGRDPVVKQDQEDRALRRHGN
ncbi:hypothetical protein MTO96_045483, partial [Rhipicephalus appendiculatus]